MREQSIIRYIEPLREGGSLPALVEADDGFFYVVKFRGGGHGAKALIAELIGGEIARTLGLNVPELVLLELPPEFGITEPDQEVQDLLKSSAGINIGLHHLKGAITLDAYKNPVTPEEASMIVWLDAYLTNVDRTPRNTNLLLWHGRETWIIDNGASLLFHHSWTPVEKAALSPFQFIKNHALLHKASLLNDADKKAHQLISAEKIDSILDTIPEEWLKEADPNSFPMQTREVYKQFLLNRLNNSSIFLNEAKNARKALI